MGEIKKTDLHTELQEEIDKIPILLSKVEPETPLNTTSQNLSGAVNEVNTKLVAHEAEMVSQVDGIHGLKIETGSWTPEFANSLNTTYTKQVGRYVKTNSKVYISFELQVSNLGSFTGQPTIKGIPFKPNPQTVLNIGLHEGIDISDVGDSLCGSLLLENLIQFTVSKKNGGALSVLASTAIKSNFRIYGQATYLI